MLDMNWISLKWLARILGALLILAGILWAQFVGVKELFPIMQISVNTPMLLIGLGLVIAVSPNNDDFVSGMTALSKIPTRILLASRGINYDAQDSQSTPPK